MEKERRDGGVEEVVVVAVVEILSSHAGWGGGRALKSFLLVFPSILDPCKLTYCLAVSVLPLPLSFTIAVSVPFTMAVPLPAAFSVVVLMPIATAGLVASALLPRAAVIPFPGTLSPGGRSVAF